MEAVLEDPLHPALREEAREPEGPDPAARAGGEVRPAAADRRRGRRGRGARDADRQPDPRRAEVRGGQGAGLRRSPQGDAGGHGGRSPAARSISEELGLKLENVSLAQLGRAKRVVVDKDNTTIIGGAGEKATSTDACSRSAARSRRRPATTTGRSCRSGWRSSRAASP